LIIDGFSIRWLTYDCAIPSTTVTNKHICYIVRPGEHLLCIGWDVKTYSIIC